MKKITIFLLMSILLIGCVKSYHGYIYDYDMKKPLEGVIINDYLNGNKTITNSKGYFFLKNDGKMSPRLILSFEGYLTDTINSIQIHNGEQMEKKFEGETIYMFNERSVFFRFHKKTK